MNDNNTQWRAAEFPVAMVSGRTHVVRGSVCGVFAIHDDEVNNLPSGAGYRISITHLPSGAFIGRTRNGAAAYESSRN